MSRKIRSPVMDNFGTLCCETKKGAIVAPNQFNKFQKRKVWNKCT